MPWYPGTTGTPAAGLPACQRESHDRRDADEPDMMFFDSLSHWSARARMSMDEVNAPLRTHAHNGTGRRSNECDAFLCEAFSEVGVLAEEAVARMYCLVQTVNARFNIESRVHSPAPRSGGIPR